ncbi:hypothetical protein OG259_07595 [Streptomyces sp. NBC_00250]|uniref:hypothetical protein n=1 Tax=Streptomyces sp. NBC_00250 TaxID=2903641 RepID=UPI002E2AC9D0|nr:hypothetical protein [Streptomyces sp. NBC_00250]
MDRFRLTRKGWARAGVLAGGGLVTAGVGLAVDLAAALISSGVMLVAYCVVIADIGGDDT